MFKKILVCALSVVLFACGGGGGSGSEPSVTSLSGGTAVKASVLPAGITCPNGGIEVQSGIDDNNNSILDPDEIDKTEYVCNGAAGTNGTNGLNAAFLLADEPAGTNCITGGKKIQLGLDDNGNGTLDLTEIDTTTFVCNGTNGVDGINGTNGVDGLSTLFITSQEPKGTNCQSGGIKMQGGIDNNGNGFLDADEVVGISYVCNGNATEVRSLLSITTEPAGVNCQQDGKKINSGIDDNFNFILDPEEIDSFIYLCEPTVINFKRKLIGSGLGFVIAIKNDETVVFSIGEDQLQTINTSTWNDIVSVATGEYHAIGLKKDATVIGTGNNDYGQLNTSSWKQIIAIDTSETFDNRYAHTVGLTSGKTVVATGSNDHGELEVSNWTDIIDIAAGAGFTVGLKSDGTVVTTGSLDLSSWNNIVSVSSSYDNVYGVKSDGTVEGLGWDVSGWQNIISVSGGHVHAIGLKSDGTVVGTGINMYGQLTEIDTWTNIVEISGGGHSSVGVKSDGTVVVVGNYATESVLNVTNGWDLF